MPRDPSIVLTGRKGSVDGLLLHNHRLSKILRHTSSHEKTTKMITYMLDRLTVRLILHGPLGPPISVVGVAVLSKPGVTGLPPGSSGQ